MSILHTHGMVSGWSRPLGDEVYHESSLPEFPGTAWPLGKGLASRSWRGAMAPHSNQVCVCRQALHQITLQALQTPFQIPWCKAHGLLRSPKRHLVPERSAPCYDGCQTLHPWFLTTCVQQCTLSHTLLQTTTFTLPVSWFGFTVKA